VLEARLFADRNEMAFRVLTPAHGPAVLNPLRFQHAAGRLADARVAIARLSAGLQADAASQLAVTHTMVDLDEAARLFEATHLLFIKLENLLTIIEWQIERLSPHRRQDD